MRLQNQAHQTSLYRDGTQGGHYTRETHVRCCGEDHGWADHRTWYRTCPGPPPFARLQGVSEAGSGRRARVEGRQLDVGEGRQGGEGVTIRGRGRGGTGGRRPQGDDDGGCGGDVDGESDGDDGGGRGCAQTKFGESIANLLPVYLSEPSSVLNSKTVT